MNTLNMAQSLGPAAYGLEKRPVSSVAARSSSTAQPSASGGEVQNRGLDGKLVNWTTGGKAATVKLQENTELSYGIRDADQAMGEIGDRLAEAKADLTKIVKMFPPFPRESRERSELLNSYRSLRAQIDRLTFPPEKKITAQILQGEKSSGLPEELQGFSVVPGKGGLDIKEPPADLDKLADDELVPLIEDLGKAEEVLFSKRQSLKEVVVGDADSEVQIDAVGRRVGSELSRLGVALTARQGQAHAELPQAVWDDA